MLSVATTDENFVSRPLVSNWAPFDQFPKDFVIRSQDASIRGRLPWLPKTQSVPIINRKTWRVAAINLPVGTL